MSVRYRKSGEEKRHGVFVYRTKKGFSWAGTKSGGFHKNLDLVAKEVADVARGEIMGYCTVDLRDNATSFIDGEGNQLPVLFRRWKKIRGSP